MQNANPPKRPVKRPVGRPRKDAQAQVPVPPHSLPPSALNVDILNIASSNQTTNHFLGAGAVQRSWMRPNDASAVQQPTRTTLSSAPQTSASLARSSPASASIQSPSTTTSIPEDGATHVPSPQSNHAHLPPHQSGLGIANVQGLETVQDTPADIPGPTLGNDTTASSHTDISRETNQSPDLVEVLDLSLPHDNDDDGDLQLMEHIVSHTPANTSRLGPIQSQYILNLNGGLQPDRGNVLRTPSSTSRPGPIQSQHSSTFTDLPVLDHSDFDEWVLTLAPLDTTTSIHTDRLSDVPSPQLNVTQQTPSELPPVQTNFANFATYRDSSQQRSLASQVVPSVNRPQQSLHPLLHIAGIPSQTASMPVHQPARTSSVPHFSPTQLLTPEKSPLNFPTTLSQSQGATLDSARPGWTHPQSQPRNWQANHNHSFVHPPGSVLPTARPPNTVQSMAPTVTKGSSYLATLDKNLEDMSSINLNTQHWERRYSWLKDACQRNDLFFLHLNQLYCMWNVNPHNIRYLGLDGKCSAGFAVLEFLFGTNANLSTEIVALLAGWPTSAYTIGINVQMKQWTSMVAAFLPVLGLEWAGFRQRCLARRVPPMTSEIIHQLHCPPSFVLPRLIFASLQYQINPTAPPKLNTAIFRFFDDNSAAVYSGRAGSADFGDFKASYRTIYAQFSKAPGLSPEQAKEIRSILTEHHRTRPSNHPTTAAQTQSRTVAQTLQNATPADRASTTRTDAPHVRPANASSDFEPNFIPPSRAQLDGAFTPLRPSLHSFTLPSQGAAATGSGMVQQPPGGLSSSDSHLMRPPGVPVPHGRLGSSLATVVTAQRLSTSLPTPSVLGSNSMPNASERLLPIAGQPLPAFLVDPDPIQESLHQAHLRQPLTELKVPLPSSHDRLYQYIEDCALEPYPWLLASGLISIPFDISDGLFERRCEITQQLMGPFEIPKRIIDTNSVLFNLRCVKIDEHQCTDGLATSWAALPTYWPRHIFISINNQHLEIRRKRHNRRDLPVDVTSYIVPGKNEVKISVYPEANESNVKCGIGVEVVGFCDHLCALELPSKIDAVASLESITSVMKPRQDSDDDDLVLVDDSMTISITDPFSARIFTIPVRGKTCKHRECFDLETFLQSRPSDYKDALTSVYGWQCPICNGDARPCNLVMDEFFKEVRDKVFELGQEEARAIVVKVDGSWKIKQDSGENTATNRRSSRQGSQRSETPLPRVNGGEPTSSTNGQQPSAAMSTNPASSSLPPQSSRVVEIIELD